MRPRPGTAASDSTSCQTATPGLELTLDNQILDQILKEAAEGNLGTAALHGDRAVPLDPAP